MNKLIKLEQLLDKISEWALYILIFALPFSKSIIEACIITAIICTACKRIIKGRLLLPRTRIDIMLYVFIGFCLLSFINSEYIELSVRAFLSKTLEYALIFLITKEIINTREKLNNFITMALLSCVIIIVDGFTQYFITHVDFLHNYVAFNYVTFPPGILGVPTASFPYPNDFSAWILMFIFPMGSFIIFGKQSWKKSIIPAFAFLSLTYLLFLTKVRGAWAAFIAVLGGISLFKLNRILVILVIFLLLFALVAEKNLRIYVTNLTSISDRMEMWKTSWNIFKKHPIIGNGLNTFFTHYRDERSDMYKGERGSYAHNCYLQMASDIGSLGLLSFLIFAGAIIKKGFNVLKKAKKEPFYYSMILGLALGLIAFLLHSAVDTNLYSLNLAVLFWVMGGLLLATARIAESEIK